MSHEIYPALTFGSADDTGRARLMCPARLSWQRHAEACPETSGKFFRREAVVLSAADLDLDRTQERGDPSGRLPIKAVNETMNEAGAIGVPATGRIDDRPRRGARDHKLAIPGVDQRAFRPARHDECLHVLKNLRHRPAGLLLHELP